MRARQQAQVEQLVRATAEEIAARGGTVPDAVWPPSWMSVVADRVARGELGRANRRP